MRPKLHRSTFVWTSLLATLLSFSSAAQDVTTPEEQRDIVRQRSEWFYGQRAYPHKRVPAFAHQRALRQLDRKLASEALARVRAGGAPTPSTPLELDWAAADRHSL